MQILNTKNVLKKFYSHVHTTLIILMIFFSLFFSSFSFISSQPPLSSHFLLHLPSEFLSFPPSPICVSQSTINPARLSSSDLALPLTQLWSSPSVDPSPIQPFRRPSLPISAAHSADLAHRSSSTPHRLNSPTQTYSSTRRRPNSPISVAHFAEPTHRSSSTPNRPNSPTQTYSSIRRQPSLSLKFHTLANPSHRFSRVQWGQNWEFSPFFKHYN